MVEEKRPSNKILLVKRDYQVMVETIESLDKCKEIFDKIIKENTM